MRVRIAPWRVCLFGALAFALIPAAPALGAPAGDEYLPSVPKADGKESAAGGNQGGPAAPAPAPQDSGGPPADSSGNPSAKDAGKEQEAAKAGAAPATPVAETSSSDDSSGALDTLLDPVVLLLLAGVAITVIGMTMRRRQAVAGDVGGGERPTRELGSAPRTPDGEIIGREPPA